MARGAAGYLTAPPCPGYFCYIFAAPSGLTALSFADEEYPSRVAFAYLGQVVEELVSVTGGRLPPSPQENCLNPSFKAKHDELLEKFQDPAKADQITGIMRQLDETKVILVRRSAAWRPSSPPQKLAHAASSAAQHETIDAAIARGEKLDTLVDKSNELSGSSKMFFTTARKQNSCCRLM